MQQGVQTDATCNIQQCWELLATILRPIAQGFTMLTGKSQSGVGKVNCKAVTVISMWFGGLLAFPNTVLTLLNKDIS